MFKLYGKLKPNAAITLLIAMVMVLTCITGACQPTPEKTVIIQKDNFEELVNETAQPSSGESQSVSADKKHITWEDEFIKKYPGSPATSIITLKVDADIDAVQKPGSVFMVEPDSYDLDFAKKAIDYFVGDEYYDDVFTKDDILLKILPMEQALQSMEDDKRGSKSGLQSFLNRYKSDYERAPERNAPGKIEFEKAILFDYIGLKGYPYEGAVSEIFISNGGKRYTDFYYVIQDGKKEYFEWNFMDSNIKYSGTPARNMNKSYKEAKKTAEDAVYELYGENMALVQTYLQNIRMVDKDWGNFNRGLLDDSCSQCYLFTFTPVYGGFQQLYAPEAKNEDDFTNEGVPMYEQRWDYEYSMQWPAQYVQVLVDDSGIVELWGFSPAKIAKTVNDNVEILSFDEIFEIFKKQIFYCSVWAYAGLETVDINIDEINFGMIRTPVKDKPDTYYMIPAWQFAGSKKETHIQGKVYYESGKTFLVLNAIDGSIIDTSYYINVKGDLQKTIGVNKN